MAHRLVVEMMRLYNRRKTVGILTSPAPLGGQLCQAAKDFAPFKSQIKEPTRLGTCHLRPCSIALNPDGDWLPLKFYPIKYEWRENKG